MNYKNLKLDDQDWDFNCDENDLKNLKMKEEGKEKEKEKNDNDDIIFFGFF